MSISSHFDDCPYNCNVNGELLDTNTGRMVKCPYCSEKKKILLREGRHDDVETKEDGAFANMIGMKNQYLSDRFVYDTVIPEAEHSFLDKDSIDWQRDEANALYNSLLLGELPTHSMCFGIGMKGRVDRFVYPMLATAYKNGLSICRFVTAYMFTRLVLSQSDELDDFLTKDIVFIHINDGVTDADTSNVTGLMQSRAIIGKPTLLVTNWTIESVSGMLSFLKEKDEVLALAKPIFVRYYAGKEKETYSRYVMRILGDENWRDGADEPAVKVNGLHSVRNKTAGTVTQMGVSLADL